MSQNDAEWLSAILSECGVSGNKLDSECLFILSSYSSNHRHYHVIAHIRDMMDTWMSLTSSTKTNISHEKIIATKLAILFHDIVYDTTWNKNTVLEEISALEFVKFVKRTKLNIVPEMVVYAMDLIRSTATHTPLSMDYCSLAFLDSDMAILASDQTAYTHYMNNIRSEWSHIDESTYRHGRMNFLTDVLETPRIFFTEPMNQKEECARENMRMELRFLDPTNM